MQVNASKVKQQTILLLTAILIAVATGDQTSAVDVDSPAAAVPSQIKGGFRPAYTVTPIVQQLEARRGQKISFQFEVVSLQDDVKAIVRPVALRQDKSGAIVAAAELPAPDAITLDGKDQVELKKGEPVIIRGTIRLPNNTSPLHSFGILIRDLPREVARSNRNDSVFGLKFVTQYVLRCDVRIVNSRSDDLRKLSIDSAGFVDSNGLPTARVVVTNPTDSTLEFQLESRLTGGTSKQSSRFIHLVSPVMSSLNEPERWTAKIFPQSSINLEAPWPNAVFVGEYQLESRIMSKRRVFSSSNVQVNVGESEFRAQEAYALSVAPGVNVDPAQVGLGQSKEHGRFASVNIRNLSDKVTTFEIAAIEESGGSAANWFVVRPSQFDVRAGSQRKIVVSLGRVNDRTSQKLGFMRIIARDSQGNELGQQNVPVAFFGSGQPVGELTTGDAKLFLANQNVGQQDVNNRDEQASQSSLVLPVTNNTNIPQPISALLSTTDEANNAIRVQAGFGKWLLPGKTTQITFPLGDIRLRRDQFSGTFQLLDATGSQIASQEFSIELK